MKKRFFRKVLCVLLAAAFLLSFAAGCSSGEKKAAESDAKASETKAGADTAPVSEYPVVKQPITLKYWLPMNANAIQYIRDNNENEAYQELEKRTGIHMDFIHPAQGQENEQFNLAIASGELPDIIAGGARYKGGEVKGVDDGVFADLTPLIPKYAPDYYKLVAGDAEIKREVTADDGRFPAFYMIKPVADPPYRRIMVRKDWLTELGLDIPKTIDDYEKMFKLMKEKKNLAPYLLIQNGMEEQFTGAYGVLPGLYLPDGKKVAFGQIQPQYKDYLTLMNKWYMEGYISKDFPGLKGGQPDTMFDSGKVGMYVSAVVATYNRSLQVKTVVDSAPYPRLKLGDKLHYEFTDIWPMNSLGLETVISSKSKYKTEAVRWLNYGYTKEGAQLYNYGIEGKTYTMADGKSKYTDYILNNPKFGTEAANYILRIHFGPKLSDTDINCNPNLAKSPESTAIRKKWADDKDVDSIFRLPPIQLTSDEIAKRSQIMTEVNTYCDEMTLKFILGAEPLSKFDDFVNNVKKLKIDEAVKLTQDAYDRYMSKK